MAHGRPASVVVDVQNGILDVDGVEIHATIDTVSVDTTSTGSVAVTITLMAGTVAVKGKP